MNTVGRSTYNMNYGTNNPSAFSEPCPGSPDGKHQIRYEQIGRCLEKGTCKFCGSVHRVDSSD